jgi:hypothetical protein
LLLSISSFIFVQSLCLDLKDITTSEGSDSGERRHSNGGHDGDERTRQRPRRQRQATATSNGDGGHGGIVDATAAQQRRRADTSMTTATGNSDDIDSDKTTMNTPTVTDGITVVHTMTMMTGTVTADTATSGSSSGINVAPTTAIPTSIVARPQGGPIAFLEDRAAMLSQRADEAAAFARAAVTDAQDVTNAHASILAKHRKMFLERAFGIDPDGRTVIELKKEFKSVKIYKKYNDMIHVISNWGDSAFLKEASVDDPVANAFQKFRKSNPSGYNYVRDFNIEVAETLDESQRLILKHKKSGGIVSHMLNIFDIIH